MIKHHLGVLSVVFGCTFRFFGTYISYSYLIVLECVPIILGILSTQSQKR